MYGALAGVRTRDLRIKSLLLYQLSYERIMWGEGRDLNPHVLYGHRSHNPARLPIPPPTPHMADGAGFEPVGR